MYRKAAPLKRGAAQINDDSRYTPITDPDHSAIRRQLPYSAVDLALRQLPLPENLAPTGHCHSPPTASKKNRHPLPILFPKFALLCQFPLVCPKTAGPVPNYLPASPQSTAASRFLPAAAALCGFPYLFGKFPGRAIVPDEPPFPVSRYPPEDGGALRLPALR